MPQPGWWFKIEKQFVDFEPPPRLAPYGGFAKFLDVLGTPPGQEGQSPSPSLFTNFASSLRMGFTLAP
jgi:hypothetical protein